MELIMKILAGLWSTLQDMAPSLLFGFFIAGILSVFLSQKLVEDHLGGSGFAPIVKASLFGVPLPLCSCSVIPVASSLRRHGSSRAATTSFLLSTPQTGVDSILVTYSLLGPVLAVFRPLSAFLVGLIGGEAIRIFDKNGIEADSSSESCCCSSGAQESKSPTLARIFKHGFITLPRDIGKSLLVGLLIAGTIGALLPPGFFGEYIGTGFAAMLVMMMLGVPVYVCATASVPIAAAMIAKGATPGAALVFLMTGPATNAATIGALWKMMGHRATIIYLATVALTALGCGLLLDLLFEMTSLPDVAMTHSMGPEWLNSAAAITLIAVICYAIFGYRPKGSGS